MNAKTVATKNSQRSKMFDEVDARGDAETRLRWTDDAQT
jgi:hypothetical protein